MGRIVKFIFYVLSGIVGIFLIGLIILGEINRYQTTFFTYPNIKEHYKISDKVDSAEEALEVCRTRFETLDPNGNKVNIPKENIWDGHLRRFEELKKLSSDLYVFEIRVRKELFGDRWYVSSEVKPINASKCIHCYLYLGPKRAIGECTINSKGDIVRKD